ncbi:DNA polymerase delta subunit 4 family protein [Cryptosporidium meleagridis]|uniref:DNA polymerase delta subunit 4 family protein n=1 Tax=Cryptosporidium meleagridis TaxID=93969 RepID=A0A2P4YZX5_9CRYT|nr:DNA polymerase delta subunit 4 family protein [Cryptosporidium meleagridis]
MPRNVNKKRKRSTKDSKEDENQSKLVGFKTSIVSSKVNPELETSDLKPVKSTDDSEQLLKTLHSFDLDHTFGPCSEISRSQRLERAKKFGIAVDLNLENLINKHCGDVNSNISVSIIDKLMKHYAD